MTSAQPREVCPDGVCITRPEIDKINLVFDQERRCQESLTKCRDKPPIMQDNNGWDPMRVVIIGSAAIVGAFVGGAFLGASID